MALLLVPVAACSKQPAEPTSPTSPTTDNISTLEQEVFTSINAHRVSKGLTPLAWSDLLAEQARGHSRDMAAGTTPFGHEGLDNRLAIIGRTIPWTGAAENVAATSVNGPAASVVDLWLTSPPHLANIDGDYNLTGVGAARGTSLFCTQIFVKSK